MLIRYWFEFITDTAFGYPAGIGYGCGVTAYNITDAKEIMNSKIFYEIKIPAIERVIEDVDIRILDQSHVVPNMSTPVKRGIWFPLGYD